MTAADATLRADLDHAPAMPRLAPAAPSATDAHAPAAAWRLANAPKHPIILRFTAQATIPHIEVSHPHAEPRAGTS